MNNINLVNFHLHPKNSKFIHINKINNTHDDRWLMPFGNGFNRYILSVEVNSKIHKIYIEEKHVTIWKIADQTNDCIEFYALGKLNETGQYIRLNSYDQRDFRHLNRTLKIIDILVENDHQNIQLIDNINDNIKYCDKIMSPRYENIEMIFNVSVDISKKVVLRYEKLFDSEFHNKILHFVLDDDKKSTISFEIINITKNDPRSLIDKNNEGNDFMNAYIYRNCVKYFVPNIELFYDSNCDDDYNISLKCTIKYNILNEHYVEEINEYCYIAY